jgi:hypothetical protein
MPAASDIFRADLGLFDIKGWTADSFDFFTVSLTVSDLAEQFEVSAADITLGITRKWSFTEHDHH